MDPNGPAGITWRPLTEADPDAIRGWRPPHHESLRRFKAEGLEYAAIDVDAASPTGAFVLYERLGFVEQHRSVSLMKEFGAGPSR